MFLFYTCMFHTAQQMFSLLTSALKRASHQAFVEKKKDPKELSDYRLVSNILFWGKVI